MMTMTNQPVRHVTQPKSKLCWATCVRMVREVILNKQNDDITPEKIYESVTYDDGNTTARDKYIIATLERWGVECSQYVKGKISFANLQQEINNQKPLIIGLKGRAGGAGHVIVLGGWELRGPTRWCRVYDPAKAAYEDMPFRALEEDPDWDATFLLKARIVNI